jgi:hypothetical protein
MADVGLATFQSVKPVDYSGLTKGIQDAAAGYKQMKQNEVGKAYTQLGQEREEAIPTEQSDMLDTQTADMGLEGEQAIDEGTAQESSKKLKKTRDWGKDRADLMNKAVEAGMDWEQIQALEAGVTAKQMEGVKANAKKALEAYHNGDQQGVLDAINEAYSYYPDGTYADMQWATNPQTGQPVIVGQGYDEETGEAGGTMMFKPEELYDRIEMMTKSPEEFVALTRDRQAAEKDFDLKTKKYLEDKRSNKAREKYNSRQAAVAEAGSGRADKKLPYEIDKLKAEAEQKRAAAAKEKTSSSKVDKTQLANMDYKDLTKGKTDLYEQLRSQNMMLGSAKTELDKYRKDRTGAPPKIREYLELEDTYKSYVAEEQRRMGTANSSSAIPEAPASAAKPAQGIPAGAKQSADGNYYAPDGSVYNAQGQKLGSWK